MYQLQKKFDHTWGQFSNAWHTLGVYKTKQRALLALAKNVLSKGGEWRILDPNGNVVT